MNYITHSGFGGGSPAHMTTREIADLTSKVHRNVMRDCDVMFAALGIDSEGYAQIWTHPQNGQSYREYALPRDLTVTLVSGYDIALRHRIVKRLEEIEAEQRAAPGFVIPPSYAEALRLAADNADRADRAEAKIAHDAPAVAFAEQVQAAPDAISLGQAAKIAGTGRNRLSSLLKREGWLTRYGEPYQSKVTAGYLDVKISPWEHPKHGLKERATPLVTGKGLPKIVAMVQAEMRA